MAGSNTEFEDFLAGEVKKYSGVMVPVKASVLERLFVKKAAVSKLHPNPEDEFCFPSIGPNYEIISNYEKTYRQYGTMQPDRYSEPDPVMVEKIHPDGYMILNGHHRWAASMRLGLKKMRISIVNLTQETDIRQMLKASDHDKRVTLDLDEVIFCAGEDMPAEKPLRFPYDRIYKERLRLGIPALLHYLSGRGYDIWVYTARYYSVDYLRGYFKKYTARVDGIITGTGRQRPETRKRTEELFSAKYLETIHIDNDMVLRTFRDPGQYEEYSLKHTSAGWSQEVMDIIKGLDQDEKQ